MGYFGPKKHVPENDEMFLKNGMPIPHFASEGSAMLDEHIYWNET